MCIRDRDTAHDHRRKQHAHVFLLPAANALQIAAPHIVDTVVATRTGRTISVGFAADVYKRQLPDCQAGECAVFRFFKKPNQERRMNYSAITFREDAIASATGRKAASEAGVKRNI